MKFNVKNLIETIEQKIKDTEAAAIQMNADEQAKIATHRQEWLDKHKDGYLELADKLKEKLRKNRPILESDIPKGVRYVDYRADLATYSPYRPKKHTAQTSHLLNALKVLRSITDEEITAASLRSLGFKDVSALL